MDKQQYVDALNRAYQAGDIAAANELGEFIHNTFDKPAEMAAPAQPIPDDPEGPGFFERSYDRAVQGVSDAFSTIAGDSYGTGGDPTARRDEGVL